MFERSQPAIRQAAHTLVLTSQESESRGERESRGGRMELLKLLEGEWKRMKMGR